jgi:hypothetical protein
MLLDLVTDWQRIAATIVASGGARVGGSAAVTVREKQIATGGLRVSGSAVITTHVQQPVVAAAGGGFGQRMRPKHTWTFPTSLTASATIESVHVTAHSNAVVTARLEAIASINPETQLDRDIFEDDEEILLLLCA